MSKNNTTYNNNINNNNNKISFGRKICNDNLHRSLFKLEDLSIEDEKMGKSLHANKNLKKSLIVQDKNNLNIINKNDKDEVNNNHDETFIDNKLKSLINLKNKTNMKSSKKLSILNLLNFSIRTNYFMAKEKDFSLIKEYVKSVNLKEK